MDLIKIGQFIKRKRLEKGLTQEQLASLLYVNPKTVSRWERGLNLPDISVLNTLSEILEVTEKELLLGDTYGAPKTPVMKIHPVKKIIMWGIVFNTLLLIDASIGYFSISLGWNIHNKVFNPKGMIFTILFGSEPIVNQEGIMLTKMKNIFLFILVCELCLICIYFSFSLYSESKRRKENQ